MHGCFDTHKGQIVGHVHTFLILTAGDQILEQRISGKAFSGSRVTAFVQIVQFDPDTVNVFLSLFTGQFTGFEIRFEIRIHILVKTSRRNRMTAGLCLQKLLYKPERLAGFVKALGRFGWYAGAVFSNLKKLALSYRIGTFFGFLKSQQSVALRVQHCGIAADLNSFQEGRTLLIIGISAVDRIKSGLRFGLDSLKTDSQHFFVFNGKMTDTIVEIVARSEDIVLHGQQCVIGHICCSQLTGSFALPVLENFVKSLLSIFRNIERIGRSRRDSVKFILQPGERIFREHLTSTGSNSIAADDQLIRTNNDRKLFTDRVESFGTAHNDRFILSSLIALGEDNRTVGLDHGHILIQMIDQSLNSRAFGDFTIVKGFHMYLHRVNLFPQQTGIESRQYSASIIV